MLNLLFVEKKNIMFDSHNLVKIQKRKNNMVITLNIKKNSNYEMASVKLRLLTDEFNHLFK